VPKDEVLLKLYSQIIEPEFLANLEEDRLTLDNFNRIAGEMDTLFRLCGKHPSKIKFLDYGFGHGRWSRVARAIGAKVYATEIGNEKKSVASGIGVEIIADSDIDGMLFDIVHTEQVFEHLVDPAREFGRLAAATEGIMKVAVPHHGDILGLLSKKGMASSSPFVESMLSGRRLTSEESSYISVLPLEHLNTFSPKAIARLAKDHGMHIFSRTRKASVSLNFTTLRLFSRSVLQTGSMIAKSMLAPDRGYYLLRPSAFGSSLSR
jgi:hypothetical protein